MVLKFIDEHNRVDREGLRHYALQELTKMKQAAQLSGADKRDYWKNVEVQAKKKLFGKEADRIVTSIQQITHLPFYIQLWIETAVDSPERFDFFVLAKAHELNSGDQERDYFWALAIRHDQLMGLIRILQLLISQMKLWVTMKPDKVLADPGFATFTAAGVEEQVYLEAEKVYQERQHPARIS